MIGLENLFESSVNSKYSSCIGSNKELQYGVRSVRGTKILTDLRARKCFGSHPPLFCNDCENKQPQQMILDRILALIGSKYTQCARKEEL